MSAFEIFRDTNLRYKRAVQPIKQLFEGFFLLKRFREEKRLVHKLAEWKAFRVDMETKLLLVILLIHFIHYISSDENEKLLSRRKRYLGKWPNFQIHFRKHILWDLISNSFSNGIKFFRGCLHDCWYLWQSTILNVQVKL